MINFDVDLSDLVELAQSDQKVYKQLQQAANRLAVATHAHIIERATEKLHTRRAQFVEALSFFQVDNDTWVINLDASARWIDDGMPEHSMLPKLLASPKAKRAADGSTYITVPFVHNKGPTQLTPKQQALTDQIKKELRKIGSSINKIETDRHGAPRVGLVRSMDITNNPISTSFMPIGKGPFGQVAQGPTGIPLLQGVQVYQKKYKDKEGTERVGKQIVTFRRASSKMSEDRWKHPGVEAVNLMDAGMDYAWLQWQRVGRDLLDKLDFTMDT